MGLIYARVKSCLYQWPWSVRPIILTRRLNITGILRALCRVHQKERAGGPAWRSAGVIADEINSGSMPEGDGCLLVVLSPSRKALPGPNSIVRNSPMLLERGVGGDEQL